MNMRRLVIGIVVLAVLALAGYWAYTQFVAPEPTAPAESETTDVDEISIATDIDMVTAEGQVIPLRNTQLSFPAGGEIVEIFVAEGEAVAGGDPLIRLDTVDQEIGIEQANATVLRAEANVQTAEAGLLAAQAGIVASEVALDVSKAQLALLVARATAERVALGESNVAVAEARVTQAAGNRDASLERASSADIVAAEAQVATAQAQYDAAVRTFQPITQDEQADDVDREQAQLQINIAQANLRSAQAALDRLRAGPTSAANVAANSGVSVAMNQLDAAQANLNLLLAGPREQQIAVAASAVSQAESHLEEAEIRAANAETAVVQAQTALEEARVGLSIAESDLTRRTLTAPFSATVAALLVKAHEVASPAVPVITLADFSEWRIETADLSEADVVNIARDFPAEIRLDAFPGEVLKGRVAGIASISDLIRGDVTYVTTLVLDDDRDLPLRWGMTALVSVDIE
jgi:multidrug efflux pump subunit AcrA (membrane-fusion protein)